MHCAEETYLYMYMCGAWIMGRCYHCCGALRVALRRRQGTHAAERRAHRSQRLLEVAYYLYRATAGTGR